ncbi:hypothetical protein SAMN05660649_03526 [Desulfotomaculum arcticum]|uniref:Uncharacterized protein n=1 Tax=Desulfotruncus arcticus DSM 17038 TaxID=1121424 RepID=A0A1I2WLI4_9FIRM|nr:hypothetical protein [Desulfotruncus arcticus]SFH02183.1 hypothetical protein SAMN05660649_03526 [Desulfotomaculum arcticum] [Desulfotruncus arcticus DSM 17038]
MMLISYGLRKNRDMAICRLMTRAGLKVQEVSDLNSSDVGIKNVEKMLL